MHKGENEPFTCDPGGKAFWADGAADAMPEPRSRRAEEAAGEKCGAKEFGYFSKCKDKGLKQKSDYDRTFILKLQFWQPYRQRSIRGWEKGTSREEGPVGYFTR